jgi:hypothetical protein
MKADTGMAMAMEMRPTTNESTGWSSSGQAVHL